MPENETAPNRVTLIDVPKRGLLSIPVVAVTGDDEVSFEDIRPFGSLVHVLTSRGPMLYSNDDLFETLTTAKMVKAFAPAKEKLAYDLEPIPNALVSKINRFFHDVYQKYHAEAIVLLFYNQTDREWMIHVPPQKVSFGSADYDNPDPTEIDPKFARMGSWHSHGSMSAFHSGTDSNDELHAGAGLHLTSGDFSDKKRPVDDLLIEPEVVASLVIAETRFTLHPQEVLESNVVDIEETGKKVYTWQKSSSKHFLTDLDDVETPAEWMDKVERDHSNVGYTAYGGGSGPKAYSSMTDYYADMAQRYMRPEDEMYYGGTTRAPSHGGAGNREEIVDELVSCLDCDYCEDCGDGNSLDLYICDQTGDMFDASAASGIAPNCLMYSGYGSGASSTKNCLLCKQFGCATLGIEGEACLLWHTSGMFDLLEIAETANEHHACGDFEIYEEAIQYQLRSAVQYGIVSSELMEHMYAAKQSAEQLALPPAPEDIEVEVA